MRGKGTEKKGGKKKGDKREVENEMKRRRKKETKRGRVTAEKNEGWGRGKERELDR